MIELAAGLLSVPISAIVDFIGAGESLLVLLMSDLDRFVLDRLDFVVAYPVSALTVLAVNVTILVWLVRSPSTRDAHRFAPADGAPQLLA